MNKLREPLRVAIPNFHSRPPLDITNNPITQTVLLGNSLQSRFSQFLQHKYDIGAVEWRILVALAREPDITLSRVVELNGLDKAAVSRALAKLDEKRLIKGTVKGTNARSKHWQLTPAGTALHGVILSDLVGRIGQVLEDIPADSLRVMTETMREMKENFEDIDWD